IFFPLPLPLGELVPSKGRARSSLISNEKQSKVFLYSIIFFTLKFCFANMSMITLTYDQAFKKNCFRRW
ncbi:MAG: hypothetical protein SOW44_01380, partial [Porphyromonas sp.]|nr:hypothetical protein [Porphyromonas sp.]